MTGHVKSCRVYADAHESSSAGVLLSSDGPFTVHVYSAHEDGAVMEGDADGEEGEVSAAAHWSLPAREFVGAWDALIFDDVPASSLALGQLATRAHLKRDLLRYAGAVLAMSDAGVNPSLVAVNRLILLHGPPGTGKTTLCKALAQKLSIRLAQRFPISQLLEVNAHSLFSKWFSESGKLVQRMFERVGELAEDPECLVIILIDEVESLTAARAGAMNGAEPSDAVRVVNAVLTQLDRLRTLPNVLVLATTNLLQAVDSAFLDRADFMAYVGLPGAAAASAILHSALQELVRCGLVQGHVPSAAPGSALVSMVASAIFDQLPGMPSASPTRLAGLETHSESALDPVEHRGTKRPRASAGTAAAAGNTRLAAPMDTADTMRTLSGSSASPARPNGVTALVQSAHAVLRATDAELLLAVNNIPVSQQLQAASARRTPALHYHGTVDELSMHSADDAGADSVEHGVIPGAAGTSAAAQPTASAQSCVVTRLLCAAAGLCTELSGRALRKLPLHALAACRTVPAGVAGGALDTEHVALELLRAAAHALCNKAQGRAEV